MSETNSSAATEAKAAETTSASSGEPALPQDDGIGPGERMSLVQEFILFLKENKAYWMAPILIVLLLLVALVVFGGSAASPFIYTLF